MVAIFILLFCVINKSMIASDVNNNQDDINIYISEIWQFEVNEYINTRSLPHGLRIPSALKFF